MDVDSTYTEHEWILWILNLKRAWEKLARLRLRLLELDFGDAHQAAIQHHTADVLSRLPTDKTDKTQLEEYLPVMFINTLNNSMIKYPPHMFQDMANILMHLHSNWRILTDSHWRNSLKLKAGIPFVNKLPNKLATVGQVFHETKMGYWCGKHWLTKICKNGYQSEWKNASSTFPSSVFGRPP